MTAQNSTGFDWPARSANKIWLGVCGGLANKWNVNAWLVRITFILFVVPLGYVYYLGAQNMPDPSARRSKEAIPDSREKHPERPSRHLIDQPLPASARITFREGRKWSKHVLYGKAQ